MQHDQLTPTVRAFRLLGGAPAIRDRFGISLQAAHKWQAQIPPKRVLEVERLTGVSKHDLRPDIFGPAPGAPAACASDEPRSELRDPRSEPKREACA